MNYAVKSTILDILSEITGVEHKKTLLRILNNTPPHRLDSHVVMQYNLRNGLKRKIDIGYYNSKMGDTDEMVSILSHLWRLAQQNKLLAIDLSVGNLVAVYKYDKQLYCSYDVVESEDKSIRICENLSNYEVL